MISKNYERLVKNIFLMFPLVLIFLVSAIFGAKNLFNYMGTVPQYIFFLFLLLGFVLVFKAKFRFIQMRKITFGPRDLRKSEKICYYLGYFFIVLSTIFIVVKI
jgi:hypothetical protein